MRRYRRYRRYRKKRTNRSAALLLVLSLAAYLQFKGVGDSVASAGELNNLIDKYSKYLFEYLVVGTLIFLSAYSLLRVNRHFRKERENKKKKENYIQSDITVVDRMDGKEFENFLCAHFQSLGFHVALTKATNDYGADLLLKRKGQVVVVQAKRYNSSVGIKAIQETCGAMAYFKANRGIVVTNNRFTKNAVQLAQCSNIELIERNELLAIMAKNKGN